MFNLSIFLSVVASIGVIAAALCAPALPFIADRFSTSVASVQFTLSLFLVGNALGQLFSGPLSDCIGQKKVMMGGLFLFILASLWAYLADAMSLLLAARFFQGMGSAVGPVLARAIAARLFPASRSARVQSYGAIVLGCVSILAIIASGYLTLYSWRNNFLLAALLGLILLIWAIPTLKRHIATPATNRPFFAPFVKALRTPMFLKHTLCHALTYGLMYGYIGLFPFLLIHYLHENDPAWVGIYSALMIGCYMVGALLNSRLVERRGPQKMVVIGIALQCLGGTILAVSSTTALFFTGLVIFNISIGFTLPATSACALAACRDSTGAASSALGLTYRLLGSLISMLIASLPLAGGMSLGLSISLLSIVSIVLLGSSYAAKERAS